MPKIPPQKARQVEAVLKKDGFVFERQHGSHRIYFKEGRGAVPIPFHKGKTIKKGTFANILRMAKMSRERYLELLKG